MTKELQVLFIEDSEDDALLLTKELRRGGFDLVSERVETAEAMRNALIKQTWDLVLSDYPSLPI
jgi:CheY-like chemotaxis protein